VSNFGNTTTHITPEMRAAGYEGKGGKDAGEGHGGNAGGKGAGKYGKGGKGQTWGYGAGPGMMNMGPGGADPVCPAKVRRKGQEKEAFNRRNQNGSAALEKLRAAINNFSSAAHAHNVMAGDGAAYAPGKGPLETANAALHNTNNSGHGITNEVLAGNIKEFSYDPDGVNFLTAALDQPN
jgi:hypothetical protein